LTGTARKGKPGNLGFFGSALGGRGPRKLIGKRDREKKRI